MVSRLTTSSGTVADGFAFGFATHKAWYSMSACPRSTRSKETDRSDGRIFGLEKKSGAVPCDSVLSECHRQRSQAPFRKAHKAVV